MGNQNDVPVVLKTALFELRNGFANVAFEIYRPRIKSE